MSETTTDELKILVPFDKRECLSLKQAVDRAAHRREMGRQQGRTEMYLEGDLKALRAYHAGNRSGASGILNGKALREWFSPVLDRRSARWNECARAPLNWAIAW
jgi:hypothetical protein